MSNEGETMTSKRYTVRQPAHAGRHFERFGWTVIDSQSGVSYASGSEADCRKIARVWNAR